MIAASGAGSGASSATVAGDTASFAITASGGGFLHGDNLRGGTEEVDSWNWTSLR